MGVGEPLLNLNLIKEVYQKADMLKKELNYDTIGYALATMMPNNNILKLTEMVDSLNIPLKVHFSMHTPIDAERFDLIPSTRVSIEEALAYLIRYRDKIQKNPKIMSEYVKLHRTNDPIEIHYTLIKGVNDSEQELEVVCNLLSKYNIPIKFIRFNPINELERSTIEEIWVKEIKEKVRFNPINELERSTIEEIWVKEIKEKVPALRVKTYSPPGREIGSSCGEFTKHYYHYEIETEEEKEEFEKWREKHLVRR